MKRKLPRTVVVLGLVSFFNDLASDMVIPLIPILLATVLAAGPVALGLIEGVADAVASLVKLWSGRHSDWLGGRRKTLTVAGYTLSNVARPLLALATSWVGVLLLRSFDRVGKGIRSAPRDALVVDTTPPEMRGRAFGFHRALDNGGAVGGALVAAAALWLSGLSLAEIIAWSALPGFVGVLLIAFGVKEAVPTTASRRAPLPPLKWSLLSPRMRRYLWVLALFTFARASETFIVLRGYELGMSVIQLLVLWAALNLAKALTAAWGGSIADRLGREGIMAMSWCAYAIAYLALGQVSGVAGLWTVTMIYGGFAGSSEGAERALISDLAVSGERGTAFGWYYMVAGVAAIPAGVMFGALWQVWGADAAFTAAGLVAGAATLLLHFWVSPAYRRAA